jgi:hypothetical protein
MNNQNNNLEALIARISYELVNEKILGENEINKLLGILSSNGVYAMWVYAKSKKEIDENKFFEKLKPILDKLNKIENLNENHKEKYFQSISEDLYKLLFLKQLLEKTLIYARYHAKALGD